MAKQKIIRYAMSRRRRGVMFTLTILAVVAAIFADRYFGNGLRHQLAANNIVGTGDNDHFKYHRKSFKVVNIVDGDTVDIAIPDGKYDNTRIRLLGVDTPETKSDKYPVMYYGPEATEFVTQMLAGKEVVVVLDNISPSRDRYNRLLAWLEFTDGTRSSDPAALNGTCVNEQIVRNGFGYTDLRFDNDRYGDMVRLQDEAVKNRIGLWDKVTKDQLPKWLQREKPRILQNRK